MDYSRLQQAQQDAMQQDTAGSVLLEPAREDRTLLQSALQQDAELPETAGSVFLSEPSPGARILLDRARELYSNHDLWTAYSGSHHNTGYQLHRPERFTINQEINIPGHGRIYQKITVHGDEHVCVYGWNTRPKITQQLQWYPGHEHSGYYDDGSGHGLTPNSIQNFKMGYTNFPWGHDNLLRGGSRRR